MQICIEGIHVNVRPEWRERAELALTRLEGHHPGALSGVRVSFHPIRPHRPGVEVHIDGRMRHCPFHVHKTAEEALTALHGALDVVRRTLEERMEA